MSVRSSLALVLSVLLLSACGTAPRKQPPAPVAPPGPPPAPPGMEIHPYQPAQPGGAGRAKPVPNRAVAVLMRRSTDQQRDGDLKGAAASLERALRIAPRDAVLWHRLAVVREKQHRFGQAADLAAKSNALAGKGQAKLVSANWLLIARVRRAVGDLAGARAAEAHAR
jgi:hypothetical protein